MSELPTCAAYVGRLAFSTDEVVSFRFKDLKDSCFSEASLVDEVKSCIADAAQWGERAQKTEAELWDKFGLSEDDLEPIRMCGWTGAWEFLLHDICDTSHGIWVPGPGYGETRKRPLDIALSYSGFSPTIFEIDAPQPGINDADVRRTMAELGWSSGKVARAIGVNPRAVRRWCKPERGRRGITAEEWEKLSALANEPAVKAPPQAETMPVAAMRSSRDFNADEQAAIEAAISDGRFRRIERGQWPS